jgi:hypothetical protein
MEALSASAMLDAWERGRAQDLIGRALTVLSAACPGVSRDTLAALTIGQRDDRLLTLRQWAFGPHVVGLAICPACSERLELSFDLADVRITPPSTDGALTAELSLSSGAYEVRFRPPNSADLAAVSGGKDVAEARQQLLERCVSAIHVRGGEDAGRDEETKSVDELPQKLMEKMISRMAEADPQADVQLPVSCPGCGCAWSATFDIAAFFWAEIEAWGRRTLREVHILASAYGWREADILAVSAWRRRQYLEMVSTGGREARPAWATF